MQLVFVEQYLQFFNFFFTGAHFPPDSEQTPSNVSGQQQQRLSSVV